MTRIRDLLISFRTRRAQRFNNCDIVSFESFRNENISDFPKVKESSLTESNKKSPTSNKGRDYVKFSSQSTKSDCSRPTLATSLLLIVLMAVFLILPIIYLLHCFGIIQISKQEFQHSHFALKAQDHYTPSTIVHDSLRLGKLYKKFGRNVLPPPPQPDPSECKVVKDINKFDCYPEDGATEEKCNARGCCWSTTKSKRFHSNKNMSVPLNMPYCYYPSNFPTYKYVNASETAFGLVIFLKRNYKSAYPNDAETLKMTVKYETQDRLHIKITNPMQNRFESPYPEVPIVDKADENLNYIFVMDERNTGFKVLRKSDNTVIFDTTGLRNLIFADQFLQISSKLPSKYIYGLGEHRTNLLLDTNWQQFTMFNRDGAPTENANLYGSHPFYLVMEDSSGNSHGVFLLNSNAMDVILQPKPAITFRPIGGILDFYFFLGPTPSEVISQYTDLIGRPFLPAYWALGFHLCRYGYKSVNDTRDIMQRNIDAGILIDTQWNDLDYMNNSNDFTFDHKNFKTLPQFVKELHNKGMHYIPLVDPGISASETPGTYPPYDKGIEMDILVKNSSGLPFIGKVWNRASTVWPDFTHPHTVDYWTLMLRSMHDSFAFDGAWIDMNEPANFLSGSFTGCPESSLETPPYLPKVVGGQLNYKTFCMTAQHYAGVHYNVHNLYGITEAIVTSFAMAEIRGKRPMVISRSTFPGHGRYAGHWSGDVYSEWHDMRYSIPQLLSFSMFGIPLMGADICGFNGNTTVALCNRWSQLGAFYPFSRNHNTDDGIPQDPVGMGQPVIDSAKKALEVRYSLLPYLYTLFWAANVQGDTVARPLFFEFPNDRLTYDIDYMFLWGSSVLIVPVLEEDKVSVNIYLPTGIWYDYYTKKAIPSVGQNVTLPAPIDQIPVLIRGGSIIPQAKPNRTTVYSRQSKLELFCAPDKNGYASGMLFWDDGDSLNTVSEKRYSLVQFDLVPNKLQSYPLWWHVEYPPNLGVIAILGIETPVKVVMINNVSQEFKYDTINKYLIVEKLNLNFSETFELTWK